MIREDIENEDELYGTDEERAEFIRQVKEWAENHENPDEGIVLVFLPNKERELPDLELEFTPLDLARDMQEGTALGVAVMDIIMYRSKVMRVPAIDYLKFALRKI